MTKRKVLILTTIWGHRSLALGAYDLLKNNGFEPHVEEIKIDPFSAKSYKAFYRFVPTFFKAFFELSKTDIGRKTLNKYFERRYYDDIAKAIKLESPDVVINTYLGFDSTIEKFLKKRKFLYFNIVPDPWTFSKASTAKKGVNLLFDEHSMNKFKRVLPHALCFQTGWFVQQKYYKKMSKIEARRVLKIDQNTFTLCAAGGSEGTFEVLKIISSFVGKGRRLQILFMCGDNKQLFDLTKSIAKIISKTTKINIIPFKFTNHMDIFYKASDLVIGKAGPNTIFECVASGVPFFAITHIAGQENGNLEIIKKYNIGYVEENLVPAAKKIRKIIDNPKILERFQKNISELSEFNQKSNQKFLEIISTKSIKK